MRFKVLLLVGAIFLSIGIVAAGAFLLLLHNSTPSGAAGPAPTSVAQVSAESASQEAQTIIVQAQQVSETPAPDPTPVETGKAEYQPPLPSQGGTCIEGHIIDAYHQTTGAGWKVTVTAEDGTTHSRQADAAGYFRFTSLPSGKWEISLEIPEGWRASTPASFPVNLSGEGPQCAQVRFKVEALACIEITKLDVKGLPGSPGGVGLPGWKFTATNGEKTVSAVTDSLGRCRLENLEPGTWTVEEEQKTGWSPAPGYPARRTITLASPHVPGTCQKLVFRNQEVHDGCIIACKKDIYGNPLGGWEISIRHSEGLWPPITRRTDNSGCVTFTGLALGRWVVEETPQRWWKPASPTSQEVNLTEPGRCAGVTFTDEPLGCVDGYKINHLNQGLPGWTITARNPETEEEIEAQTDANGYFRFEGLKLGRWIISEKLKPDWEAITPSEQEVNVIEPFKCVSIRFKNKTDYACLDVYKKDAYDGSGLPGWTITIQPAFGGESITGTTDGTGHVRFNKLKPGVYIVSEESQPDWVPITPDSVRVTIQATGFCEVVTFKNRQASLTAQVDPPFTEGCRFTHTVLWGETLSSIALRYNTTIWALKQANNLHSDFIWAGQRLCIP